MANSGSAHVGTSVAGDLAVTAHDPKHMGKLQAEIGRLKVQLGGDWSRDGELFQVGRGCAEAEGL